MENKTENTSKWRSDMLNKLVLQSKGTLLQKVPLFDYKETKRMSKSQYCAYLKSQLNKEYIDNLYIDISNIEPLDTGYLRIIALKQFLRNLFSNNVLTSVPFLMNETNLFMEFGLPIIDEINELIDTKLEMQRCNELLSKGNVTTIK